jgi:hypothetical protein
MDSREQYHLCGLWSGNFTRYKLTYLPTSRKKQKSNDYRDQTDRISLKNEVISVINNVRIILAADNMHGRRIVRRSERSTHTAH